MSRCDSAAIVLKTSELLPEPETPVNTVSRRLGISMLTFLRLFTRAPCTRIRSWLSATSSVGDCVSVLASMLIVSPSVRRDLLRADQGFEGVRYAVQVERPGMGRAVGGMRRRPPGPPPGGRDRRPGMHPRTRVFSNGTKGSNRCTLDPVGHRSRGN